MAHFAKVENGLVTQIIVAEQDFINSGAVGEPSLWIQTSYNTFEGVHLLGGEPLRKNFAGVGYTYDSVRDAFIPPKPHASGVFDEFKCVYVSPNIENNNEINTYE
jgi:hypothetical protein